MIKILHTAWRKLANIRDTKEKWNINYPPINYHCSYLTVSFQSWLNVCSHVEWRDAKEKKKQLKLSDSLTKGQWSGAGAHLEELSAPLWELLAYCNQGKILLERTADSHFCGLLLRTLAGHLLGWRAGGKVESQRGRTGQHWVWTALLYLDILWIF